MADTHETLFSYSRLCIYVTTEKFLVLGQCVLSLDWLIGSCSDEQREQDVTFHTILDKHMVSVYKLHVKCRFHHVCRFRVQPYEPLHLLTSIHERSQARLLCLFWPSVPRPNVTISMVRNDMSTATLVLESAKS